MFSCFYSKVEKGNTSNLNKEKNQAIIHDSKNITKQESDSITLLQKIQDQQKQDEILNRIFQQEIGNRSVFSI